MSNEVVRKWIRLWLEFGYDPKVQMWPEVMQRRYIMLLIAKGLGYVPTEKDERLAKFLGLSVTKLRKTKQFFLNEKDPVITEDWDIIQWSKRQYVSDLITVRTRKSKEKAGEKERSGERSREHDGNVLEAETETETKTETEEETEHVLDFPIKDKTKKYLLTQSKINEWQELFPDMDVLIECKHLRQWMLESPDNYRTNIPNFVRNCLKASYNDPKKRYTKRKSNVYIP